jgi:hypothetical protein
MSAAAAVDDGDIVETQVASTLDQWHSHHSGIVQQALDQVGFAVLDGAFGYEFCDVIRDEITALFDADMLRASGNKLHGTAIGDDGQRVQHVLMKPQVLERDIVLNGKVVFEEAWSLAPSLKHFYEHQSGALVDALNRLYPNLSLRGINQIKVQLNRGDGGCFPLHYDTTTKTSDRELTLVLYLNPLWNAEHGGEVRLLPFPFSPVDVAPVFDRSVLFCSHTMLHRVLPSHARARHCLSMWFSGEPFAFPVHVPLQGAAGQLLSSQYNRALLSKVVYRDEYEQALYECFGRADNVHDAVQQYHNEVASIERTSDADTMALIKQALPMQYDQRWPFFDLKCYAHQ